VTARVSGEGVGSLSLHHIQLSLALDEPTGLRRAVAWMLENIECATGTRIMHEAHSRYLLEYFGDMDVRKLGYPEIIEWTRHERRRGLAKETIKKRLSTLKQALLEAVAHRVLDRLPQWPVIRSDTRPTTGYWTPPQLDAAVMACDDEDLSTWLTNGWWGGMHLSDLDRFRWADVNLSAKTWVRRNTKTRAEPAVLPLPDGWHRALVRRRDLVAGHPRDLVAGHVMGNCNAELKILCERAEVPRISTIGLRHSCASYLSAEGFSAALTQHWLGLTSERMIAKHYRHVSTVTVASEMERLRVAG
jgi:integrase